MTKPFDATELILRIEAHIRRHKDTIEFARCTGPRRIGDHRGFGSALRRVPGARGRPACELDHQGVRDRDLSGDTPGQGVTRSQIQEYIWGEGEVDAHSNSITVFVRKIREKIEENPSEPKYLLTVQRVGYKMADTLG